MVIFINDTTTSRRLQEWFSKKFPYLKLVCLRPSIESDRLPARQISLDDCLHNYVKEGYFGQIDIYPSDTACTLEKRFYHLLGIKVQVLQRSDSHWIQPEGSDLLTLKEQNEKGYKASDHTVHPEYDSRIEDGEY